MVDSCCALAFVFFLKNEIEQTRQSMPLLPDDLLCVYEEKFGLKPYDANVIVHTLGAPKFFEEV